MDTEEREGREGKRGGKINGWNGGGKVSKMRLRTTMN